MRGSSPNARASKGGTGNVSSINWARAGIGCAVKGRAAREKVVVLIDNATATRQKARLTQLEKLIGDRCFILTCDSIEAHLPKELYEQAGRNKDADIAEIDAAKNERKFSSGSGLHKLNKVKRDISNAISAKLTVDDLDRVPIIRDAVTKAAHA